MENGYVGEYVGIPVYGEITFHQGATPHRCPICNGNGLVPNGFYNQTSGYWSTTSLNAEKCRTCNGTGVIWS